MKIIRHLNRLPRKAVAVPSLEDFRVGLDWALSNMYLVEGVLVHGGKSSTRRSLKSFQPIP